MHFDLNLLTALDALLDEESVGGAAGRLHLSSPAMSRALSRLRKVTGDELLVRTGRGMTLTPHAVAVRQEVHELLGRVQALLTADRSLSVATLERTFTLQWHDSITTMIGPAVLAAIQAEAAGVKLRFLPEDSGDTSLLRHGKVDLEIGAREPTLPDIAWEAVAVDQLVVAMRARHPLAKLKLSLRLYAGAQHITVSRRGRLRDPIDDALKACGLRRNVVAAVPTVDAALQFVRQSDSVVALPRSLSQRVLSELSLPARPIPLALAPIPIILSWHQRYTHDSAHVWLRGHVRAALSTILPRS